MSYLEAQKLYQGYLDKTLKMPHTHPANICKTANIVDKVSDLQAVYAYKKLSHVLSHEDFLVYRAQPVTPVKHGNLHFFTRSAIDEYLRINMFMFALVDYVKREEKTGGWEGN